MGHIAGSAFGIGTPAGYAVPSATWGFSPYVSQGSAIQPWGLQPNLQPFSGQSTSGYGFGAAQPLPQLQQLLQVLPQQFQQLQILPQQLQQLQFLQQQQLAHLQHLLQLVPVQLQQIQHLIQQVQQLQQGPPPGSGISAPLGFGMVPQAFPGPAVSHVM